MLLQQSIFIILLFLIVFAIDSYPTMNKSSIVLISIILILSIYPTKSNLSNKPDITFWTGIGSASTIKVSPNQDKVIIGHSNGQNRIYDIKGYWITTLYSSYNSKITKIEWVPSYGPITLNENGRVQGYDSNYNSLNWNLNATVLDFTVVTSGSSSIVAFNLGNQIRQYYVYTQIYKKSYYPVNSATSFVKIQYSRDYTYLFVSTNTSYVQTYYCSTGQYSYYSGYTMYPIISFSLREDGQYIGLTRYGNLYRCSIYGTCTYLNAVSSSNNVMSSCSVNKYIIIGETSYYDMDVYTQNGVFQQYLTYMSNSITGVDCSNNYLVSVDSSGYVAINYVSGEFPVWAIILIIVGSILIISAVIGVVVRKVRARKLLTAQAANNYSQVDSNSMPYFNNNRNQGQNPYSVSPNVVNPVNPYVPSVPSVPNQGYNANNPQGYNPFPSQQANNNPYLPPNPYQTNPPRNWS